MSQISDQVQIGNQYSSVITSLGDPIKESDYLGFRVLWYSSRDPFEGDLLYFENDLLTIISQGVESKTLNDYLDENGPPSISLSYYKGNLSRGDLRDTTVHVWNDIGLDVVTYGNIEESEVLLERRYNPVSIVDYYDVVGRQFVDNKEVIINYDFSSEKLKNISEYKLESQIEISKIEMLSAYAKVNVPIIISIVISIILLFVLGIFIIRRKKTKRPEEIHQQNQ